jgi:Phosphotransferase enzyme family
MSAPRPSMGLPPAETEAVLNAALRRALGSGVHVERWIATPLSKRGKHRLLRYDLDTRLPSATSGPPLQLVGKFYERNEDAQRVALVMQDLAASAAVARAGVVIPLVLALYPPVRLLVLRYEPGQSIISALARYGGLVPMAIGCGLAALHDARISAAGVTTPSDLLAELRGRIADLCVLWPHRAGSLERLAGDMEAHVPAQVARPSFLHGDLGGTQLLWQDGRVVMLDFDRCTQGDPALDLGNLLTQLRRLALRKPAKLPALDVVRGQLLAAYSRAAAGRLGRGFPERVAWYERVMLLRKIHRLAFDADRHRDPVDLTRRHDEAARLVALAAA